MKPEIDFRHVLRELSVNQQEPTEVIRELVSNAYDAKATRIWYVPLPQYNGFIFCDNGTGLDAVHEVKGITAYRAFFSIGRSTKTSGESVGYKCQGSKLCFASSQVVVLTRAGHDVAGSWRLKQISNPADELTTETDLTPLTTDTPSLTLSKLFDDADQRTSRAVAQFDKKFFEQMNTGTVIFVKAYRAPRFAKCFLVGDKPEESYLYNYVQTATKHADTRRIRDAQGFPQAVAGRLTKLADVHPAAHFYVWSGEKFIEIPPGYWYLDAGDADAIDALKLSRLRDARFSMRNAQIVKHAEQHYAFILTVDGNRRALESYASLDRKGKGVSGIRLADQRGVQISVQGVKVCSFNALLESPHIDAKFRVLAQADAHVHYLLVVDGPFQLVTNRNAITQDAQETLMSDVLAGKLSTFLVSTYGNDKVFKAMVDKLNKDRFDKKLDEEQAALTDMKAGLVSRNSFYLKSIAALAEHKFVEPVEGEEHWVGALYALIAHHVTAATEHRELWPRPLTFSARGIDSVAQPYGKKSLLSNDIVSLEYKFWFTNQENYNHALTLSDFIVCWDYSLVAEADGRIVVHDDMGYRGYVKGGLPQRDAISFEISDFDSDEQGAGPGKTVVVSLRRLLKASFQVTFDAPSVATAPATPRRKRK